MVDAVKGEGRIGRDGLVSELNVLIKDSASGVLALFVLLANVMPPPALWRRMVSQVFSSSCERLEACCEMSGEWREHRKFGSISHGTLIEKLG